MHSSIFSTENITHYVVFCLKMDISFTKYCRIYLFIVAIYRFLFLSTIYYILVNDRINEIKYFFDYERQMRTYQMAF